MDWVQFCNESTYNPHVSKDTNNHVLNANSISHACFPYLGTNWMSYFLIVAKIHGYNVTTRDFGLNLARFNLPTYHQCGYDHFSHVFVVPTFEQTSIKRQIN